MISVSDDLLRKDLLARLYALDEDAYIVFGAGMRSRLVIVGGGALIIQEVISRATHDIDALDVSPQLFTLLAKHDINGRVQTYINNFPYNYEDRLIPVPITTKVIDFYTASLEDIVIAKLYSVRDTDMKDISDPAVLNALDWDKLHILATSDDEAKLSALNDRLFQEFMYSYNAYREMYRP